MGKKLRPLLENSRTKWRILLAWDLMLCLPKEYRHVHLMMNIFFDDMIRFNQWLLDEGL